MLSTYVKSHYKKSHPLRKIMFCQYFMPAEPKRQNAETDDDDSEPVDLITCSRCGRRWDGNAQCYPCISESESSSDSEQESDAEQEVDICVEQIPDYPFYTSKVAAAIRKLLNGVEFKEKRQENICLGCEENQANQLAHTCLQPGATQPTFTFTVTTTNIDELISKIESAGIELEDEEYAYVVSSVPVRYLLH